MTPDTASPVAQALPLASRFKPLPNAQHDAKASAVWQDFEASIRGEPDWASLAAHVDLTPVSEVLTAVFQASPYLRGLIVRDKQRLLRILETPPERLITDLIAGLHRDMAAATQFNDCMRLLRRFKAEVALLTALADLGGVWPVMTVTAKLTDAADAAVQSAVRYLFRLAAERGEWHPLDPSRPEFGSGYIVVGMGKYGAYELNYSSDIDLIVFYESSLARVRDGIETSTFYVRLTRDLVRLISERTADGYVFRTDLRLRPDAGATQIALTAEAAMHYYETVGQNWERAAFIKARAVAGDQIAGVAFLAELSPFIWRKYLDFAAIADVHAMKRQIHAFKRLGDIGVVGHDIKLGRGGIREIEFFVQTQQLIAGGRQKALRTPSTLAALQELVAHDWITQPVAQNLTEAYLFLRGIEHRIQMVADEQSHKLPTNQDELERFARFAGYADLSAFSASLIAVLETVQSYYSRLFESSPELTTGASNMVFAGESDDPATLDALAALGYTQPSQVLQTVRSWHHGRYRSMRSPQARERLTQVQPVLIEALSQTVDPDQALANFDRFLADLPSGIQLFALLRTKPGLLQLVADIMGSAPRLARILSRRRRLFDAVLDPRAFGSQPSSADYEVQLLAAIPADADLEHVLDTARINGSEQSFLIGVRTLAGTLTAQDAGRAYAALAGAMIRVLQSRIETDLAAAHGTFPDSAAAIVALGKLGGCEMTASSDLDIILIYDAPPQAITGTLLSNGPKPLSAPQYYARLTQRLVVALSAHTAQGNLYDVDLRLRPSGQQGPLATSFASFVDYQTTSAWTWEHMALTRARVISGSPALRAKIEAAIAAVLSKPRDRAAIATDVRDMRARIEADKGTTNIWDLKQVRGGLVDLEFIAQYLQLIHASHSKAVLNTNTAQAIAELGHAQALDGTDTHTLAEAAALLSNLTGLLRLLSDGPFDPATAPRGLKDQLARAGVAPSFSALESLLKDTLAAVHAAFNRII
ncbi:MAG: bifunctional [glutamine synthetase] adenylyltransferase/[glutamine synthetase]-adenylyl-L-tyrosine phosphorylase [Hyphomicrobiaceae bacterium]